MYTIKKINYNYYYNIYKSINIDIILYLSFLFFTTTFFFFEETKLPTLFSLLVSLLILYRRRKNKLKKIKIIFPLILIILYINITKILNLEELEISAASPSGLNLLIFFSCIITEKSYFIYKIFDYYLKIFIFMNSFSLYYYINILFNWGAAYEMVSLGSGDFYFRNYNNLAIFVDGTIYKFGEFYISRLGGMFEEPGMLGTYAGILLVIDIILFPKRKFTKFMLVTFGILSVSFAFSFFLIFILIYYVLVLIKLIIRYYKYNKLLLKKLLRKIICWMIILIISITTIIERLPKEIKDAYEFILIERFEIKDNQLAGDNRAVYQKYFESYLERASVVKLAFGNGIGKNDPEARYASYHLFLYQIGFIGFSLVLIYPIYFLVYIPLRSKKLRYLPLTVVCGLSLYQRPDFLSSHYFMLYSIILVFFGSKHKFNLPKKYTFN